MKTLMSFAVVATTLPFFQGCPPQVTNVELVNDTNFPVEVRVIYDDDEDIPGELLEETGNEVDFTIPAGGLRAFSRDCDDFRAVMVRGEVMIIGDIGPSETTGVFREDDDFECGDTLRFTFRTPNIADLDINFRRNP